jgi:catechol 2,3-dioxygenase-like lactoylglutathione lyase family enzyme
MEAIEFRFAFFAQDFERSVSFYQDTLGMRYISGWDRPDGKGALLSAGGIAVVEIYGAAEGKTYEGPSPVAVNLAIRLSSETEVNSLYDRLDSAGVDLEGVPQNRVWGHRSFILHDPDSIPIHYYCEIG